MQLAGFAILLCLWEGLTTFLRVPEYIFPRFSVIVKEFSKYPAFFLDGFLTTSLESVAGLLFGGVAAYILAVIFSFSNVLKPGA